MSDTIMAFYLIKFCMTKWRHFDNMIGQQMSNLQDFSAGPWDALQTHISTNFITEHRVLSGGTNRSGQGLRVKEEEEGFFQVRAQRMRKVWLGLSGRAGHEDTQEEELGDDLLLYLAPGNHKAPGLL